MMRRTVTIAITAEQLVADTLAQLRAEAVDRIVLRVVLMPPLVQLRCVELPRMTDDDARQAVGRNVSRYFPDAREPQVIAVRKSRTGWMMATAPAETLSAIHDAARSFEWEVGAILPAHVAWARAARDGLVAIVGPHETTVLNLKGREILQIRRIRPNVALPPDLAAARVLAHDGEQAASIATFHGSGTSALDLVPEAVRKWRATVARRASATLMGAAAALLLLAAGVTLLGERRELNALRAHRGVIRPQVQQALLRRDTLVESSERLNLIAALEKSSERWSAVIARVAEALPVDASLSAFRAEADSVSLEGQASNAAGVFAAMRSTPGFVAVHASAPVRQEGGGGSGQPVVERFSMAARVNQRAGETP